MTEQTFAEVKNFCVVCGEEIIDKRRLAKGAVTCTREHSKLRKKQQQALMEQKECKYCRRPSTPEQRTAFKRFRDLERRRPDILYPEAWERWKAENKDDVRAFAAWWTQK